MSGATLVALHYRPHWKLTPDPAAKLGIFCTTRRALSACEFLSEMIGTMVLIIVANAICSHGVSLRDRRGAGPWLVASLVWGIGLSLGGTTGYAINPARDLGPRLMHSSCRFPAKADQTGVMRRFPWLGRLTGGVLAGLLLHFAHL